MSRTVYSSIINGLQSFTFNFNIIRQIAASKSLRIIPKQTIEKSGCFEYFGFAISITRQFFVLLSRSDSLRTIVEDKAINSRLLFVIIIARLVK